MKITTEKLPKSTLALDIELDSDLVEKSLDRAARRLSQKYNIPGFRKGKAPRFIIENYLGRAAILEEASDDIVNRAYKAALEQEKLNPVGPGSVESLSLLEEPFSLRVTVPLQPTVTLGDYRSIQVNVEEEAINDDVLARSLDALRDKHVVLQELDEARPAQQGDRLTVKLESLIDGESIEGRNEEDEIPESPLDLEPGRLVDELFNALLGANVGDMIEVTANMPEDHANEQVRGKDVTFKVEVLAIQSRQLPEWEELPTLENFEGDLEALREKTRNELVESAKSLRDRKVLDGYIEQLIETTDYDVPDVIIHDLAHQMLHEQGSQYERYGITLEQMLQYRGQTHEDAVAELLPDATRQTLTTLALQQVVLSEKLRINEEELEQEIQRLLNDYPEGEQRANAEQAMRGQLLNTVANMVLDRKLRERLIAIATGNAPALPTDEEPSPAAEPETAAATSEA